MALHPTQLDILERLLLLYEDGRQNQQNYRDEEALSSYLHAIDEIQSIVQPTTELDELQYDIYLNICDIYIRQHQWVKADELCLKAKKIALKVNDQLKVARCLDRQGDIQSLQDNASGALDNYVKSLGIKLQLLGDNNLDISSSYGRIGIVYYNQGELDEALSAYEKALKIDDRIFGRSHPCVADLYTSIGKIYDDQKKYSQALNNYKTALEICKHVYDDNHPNVAQLYASLASIYYKQGKHKQALSMFEKSIKMVKQVHGENHADIAVWYQNIALVLLNQAKYDQAITMYNQAIKVLRNLFGESHPDITQINSKIADINNQRYQSDIAVPTKESGSEESNSQYTKEENEAIKEFIDACYSTIANSIGSHWIALASDLGLSDHDINSIKKQSSSSPTQSTLATLMLNYWRKRNLTQDNLTILMKSLADLKQKKIASSLNNLLIENKKNPLCSKYVTTVLQELTEKNTDLENGDGNADRDAVEDKEYLEDYNRALEDGKCSNDFTKIVIVGPENVGKSSIMNAFTENGKLKETRQTEVAEDTNKLVNLITFDILNKKVVDFRKVLLQKVLLAIEQFKNQTDPKSTVNQQDELNANQEDKINTTSDHSRGQMTTTTENNLEITKDVNELAVAEVIEPTLKAETVDSSTDIDNNAVKDAENSSIPKNYPTQTIPKVNHKRLIYEDLIRSLTDTKGKIEDDNTKDNRYGKLFDFGGQAIYYVAHRPFLSGKSIYVLVFNINHTIDTPIEGRNNKTIGVTYRQAMREWLTSTISSHKGKSTLDVKIGEEYATYDLPIVILVASHGDLVKPSEHRKKFRIFKNALVEDMPKYRRNICSSNIIFHCKPNDNTKASVKQRRDTSSTLHQLIKQFALSQPFMKEEIPIRWYIMASILHTSADDKSKETASKSSYKDILHRIHNIMKYDEIRQLAKDCELYEDEKNLRSMLLYLHDIGDIVFCEKKGCDAMVVTNLDWLLAIFRSIIKIGDDNCKSACSESCCKTARKTGKMSESCIDATLANSEIKLNKDEKEFTSAYSEKKKRKRKRKSCYKTARKTARKTGQMSVSCIDTTLADSEIKLNKDEKEFMSAHLESCYKIARKTGKISESYIGKILANSGIKLNDYEKKFIIQLMESYDIICKIENKNQKGDDGRQFIVPYLLYSSDKMKADDCILSDWLYIGYDCKIIPYIPDGIFYCLLSACLKIWNVLDVEIYRRSAKYKLEFPYGIIIKKEDSYIGLQYCYKAENKAIAEYVKKDIKSSINANKPQEKIRDTLDTVVSERMPKFQNAHCQFFVNCSSCGEKTTITSHLNGQLTYICCSECDTHFKSTALSQWMGDKLEELPGTQALCKYQGFSYQLHRESFNKCFDIVAEKLYSYEICPFGVKLGLEFIPINEICDEKGKPYTKTMKVLHMWQQKVGLNAEIIDIIKVLQDISRVDIVEKLKSYLSDFLRD